MFKILENEIVDNLPPYKGTSGGWIKFNAVCCTHNNDGIDKKNRGNLLITGQGDIVYNCYNCKYKTGWKYGNKYISTKFKNLLSWLGIDDNKIQNLSYEVLKYFSNNSVVQSKQSIKKLHFVEKELPKSFLKITDTVDIQQFQENPDFLEIVEYLYLRGNRLFNLDNYYWNPDPKYPMMKRRLIIPFYWENKIVGYTGRLIDKNPTVDKPRYFSDVQSNYIFNTEAIKPEHKYIFIVEGPFDALAINGISMLGDKCSTSQAEWINSKAKRENKKIIVIPDQEKYGGNLLKIAIKNEWDVSFPYWENCKDAAEATEKYGYVATIQSIFSRIRCTENSINQAKLQYLGNKK